MTGGGDPLVPVPFVDDDLANWCQASDSEFAPGNFGTPGNWSTNMVPGSGDDVCITATTTTNPAAVADTYTVILNGGFSIHSLTLGGPNGTQTVPTDTAEIYTP